MFMAWRVGCGGRLRGGCWLLMGFGGEFVLLFNFGEDWLCGEKRMRNSRRDVVRMEHWEG